LPLDQTQPVAEHADRRGDFTQTVYFTSQGEARWFGREQPVEFDPSFAEFSSLMTDMRYFDLRHVWLVAWRRGVNSVLDR
jgi:hypothetical protein